MIIKRVKNTHEDFAGLIRELDAELHGRYGHEQSAYDRHNLIAPIDTAVVGYRDGHPAACGCFQVIDAQTVEIKRMFVKSDCRRKGLSTVVMEALEAWISELGYSWAILETGKGQPEAIGLYRKCGFEVIENYGPYIGLENSVCMKKAVRPSGTRH